jgi:aminoglycoside 6-adenylyltransferase
MTGNSDTAEDNVVARLAAWAESDERVRALLLTSSRVVDTAPRDIFSDYDVIVVVADSQVFAEEDAWLRAYGEPLVRFHDAIVVFGMITYTRLLLYTDCTKIDYTVWPSELPRRIREERRLPDGLDWGYRVLLDKDGLAEGWTAPTRTAYIPARPTEAEYRALIEEFWWEATYVAKNLWRDELLPATHNLACVMKLDLLRRLLEWRVEIDHRWAWRPGVLGRGLKRMLPAEIWAELERTYAGAGIAEQWEALCATTSLFRRVAIDVGEALGYAYPRNLDDRVTAYLQSMRGTPR